MPSETFLVLESVSRAFGSGAGEVRALRDVNLRVRHAEFVVILGPSGSGKTTLLNLIGGLDRPTSGRIILDGVDVSTLSDAHLGRFRRDKIGFVFQFFNLIGTLSACENVEFAAELVHGDGGKVSDLLDRVGLAGRGDHLPGELSGGEQQRVAIARALAKDPALLLCDEPTGSLDFRTGRQILGLLRDVSSGKGKACLLVTHNSAIAPIADRVIRLRDGQVVSDERNARPVPASEVEW